MPFMLGQMVPEEMELSRKDYSVIDAIHADTPQPATTNRVRHRGAGLRQRRADRHYNAAGLRAMGHAMWASYREISVPRDWRGMSAGRRHAHGDRGHDRRGRGRPRRHVDQRIPALPKRAE